MDQYLPRHLDAEIVSQLTWSGAVVIDGPKAVGKTETATRQTGSQVFLDADLASRSLALADPSLVLERAVPRLLDEWQVVPSLWNSVRHEVDRRKRPGQFIPTGSASPSDDQTRHTGTGRFSWLRMHPLTLAETGHSTGAISLRHLLSGQGMNVADPGLGFHELVERMIGGGWPVSQSFPLKESSKYARAYLDQTARVEVSVPSGPRHDPLAIIQTRDGDLIAMEVKLGVGLIDAAVPDLKKLRDMVVQKASGELKAMVVIVPTGGRRLAT